MNIRHVKVRFPVHFFILPGVVFLAFWLGNTLLVHAQHATSGPSTTAPLIPHPFTSHKPVCPPPEGPDFMRCNSEVVTDAAGALIVSDSLLAGSYGPAAFRGAYGMSGTTATTRTIAIVDAYDNPTILNDLDTYSDHFGIPGLNRCAVSTGTAASPCIQKVDQNGGTGYPAYNAGWAEEIALDVQAVHALCQNCNILLVEANSSYDSDLITAADQTAYQMGANVVSNSWGGSEGSGENSLDSYFNHPGVAYVFSTGDNGYGVQYPAASPNVTSVGGTTLLVNSDYSYNSETAWSGAGSGCSAYETKPSFQHDPGCSNRTVADVSADADPNTGAAVYITAGTHTGWYQIGGTSLAAPLVAAVFGLAGGVGNTLGNSLPYANLNYGVNLRDVTSGSNGSCSGSYLCTAMAGYDGPTGLGTPLGASAFSVSNPPGAFHKSTPTNGSIQGINVTFSWTASAGASYYELCYNTTATCSTWQNVGNVTSAPVDGFSPGKYYWQVHAVNTLGTTDADSATWWSFTVGRPHLIYLPLISQQFPPPGNFNKTTPSNGATGQPVNPTLSWTASSNATSYQYCYDDVNDNICNTNWTSTTTTSIGLSNLTLSKTYYWQVQALNTSGTTLADGGAWWSFTTASSSSWTTIMADDFEGSFPGSWQIIDNSGSGYQWNKSNCRAFAGNYSAWAVGGGSSGSTLGCGNNYPDGVETFMIYGPFSLSDATAADMTFQLWLNSETNYDMVCSMASTDGSNFDGNCLTGNSSGWVSQVFDLSNVPTLGNLMGQSNVWIALYFSSDPSTNYPEGGYVDNVLLRKCTSGSCPSGVPGPGLNPRRLIAFPIHISIQR